VDLGGREEDGRGDFDWRIFAQILSAPTPSLSEAFFRVSVTNGGLVRFRNNCLFARNVFR
jgi:hypothetical protein